MKVLYVNHTGAVSGAERSLLDLLRGLSGEVDARVACPATGSLADAVRTLGIPVDPIPRTDGSLKLHLRETPVALTTLGAGAVRTAVHARRMGADLIHANTIRAGIPTVAAAGLTGIPAVVHLRDRLPRSTVADASLRLVASGARRVVANSHYTATGLRAVTDRCELDVVYNPVDLERFDRDQVARDQARIRLALAPNAFVLALIGQITPWKGQREAIEALAELRRRGSKAHLLIVGEPKFVSAATRYDNAAYYADLQRRIATEGISDHVQLLGERQDVAGIMEALDAVLVPSWEEPFGRVVIEAMALGLPVLATEVGGPSEIIRDGIDGILLEPRAPSVWAEAIARLEASAELRARLGDAAAKRAEDFSLPRHVRAMCDVYRRATNSRADSHERGSRP